MAHEIYRNDYVGDQAAWHGIGKVTGEQFTAERLVHEMNFAYQVEKVPLYLGDGERVERWATVRKDLPSDDPDHVLGFVGAGYTVVQNVDAFSFFDEVVGEGKAIYTSAGVLGHGERTFVVARIPQEFYVKDDAYEEYVVLNNSHDGSYALRIMTCAIRVVCANTLSMALKTHKTQATIRHTTNVHARMLQATELLGLANNQFRKTEELFNKLVERPITHPLFNQYVEELFPSFGKEPGKRTKEHREGVAMALAHEWNQMPGIKNSWLSAFNAATQYVDWEYETKTPAFENALFGSGANIKQRALTLATKFAKL